MKQTLDGKTVLVIGGTGTLGQALVSRILKDHNPKKIIVFSRDEYKQSQMKLQFPKKVEFRIGDISDYSSVVGALGGVDVIINTSALKHVPIAEQYPIEAIKTNTLGPENIIRAIREHMFMVETVIGISTDKACLPMCAYGMSKALMERLLIAANQESSTRFILVRFGNILASRGSILPIWQENIRNGKEISITDKRMTRLFITLEGAVDTVLEAYRSAHPGEIYVPKIPAMRILDIAETMIGTKPITITYIGIRPGERLHEPMISKEEMEHTYSVEGYFIIHPLLLKPFTMKPLWATEYSSEKITLSGLGIKVLLEKAGIMP